MIIDEVNQKNKNKIIEVLIGEEGKGQVWVPALATDLRIMDNNRELQRVKAIHIRTLKKQNDA